MGLRDLKKEQTRELIADCAWRLFADRGFDRVTVAEVAREARVAEATVYNYFRTKEDLFYGPLEAFGARLAEAVAGRAEGDSVVAAFSRALLGDGGLLARVEAGDAVAVERLRTVSRLIAASPALVAREQVALNHAASMLADVLTAEVSAPGRDLGPQVVAQALIGVHRALLEYVRARVLGGDLMGLGDEVREAAAGAFGLLEDGLRDYGVELGPGEVGTH